MRRIRHVQETPGDIEVAVLKLTTAEHDELHRGPKQFVNNHKEHFFGENVDVREVVLNPKSHPKPISGSTASASTAATPQTETWMSVIIHHPACACVGTCMPIT